MDVASHEILRPGIGFDIGIDYLTEIFINHFVFIKKNLIIACGFSENGYRIELSNNLRNIGIVFWQHSLFCLGTCVQQSSFDFVKVNLSTWNNTIYNTIARNTFALDVPVCLCGYFCGINKHKGEIASHFSFIIISGRINKAVKVRFVQCVLDRDFPSLCGNRITDFLPNIYT